MPLKVRVLKDSSHLQRPHEFLFLRYETSNAGTALGMESKTSSPGMDKSCARSEDGQLHASQVLAAS